MLLVSLLLPLLATAQTTLNIAGESTYFSKSVKLPLSIPAKLCWNPITASSSEMVIGVIAQPEMRGGWVGVGFNDKLHMTTSTAVLAFRPEDTNQDTVLEYLLTSKSSSGVRPAKSPVSKNNTVEISDDGIVSFIIRFPLPSLREIKTSQKEKTGIIFAWGDRPSSVQSVPMHAEFGASSFMLADASADAKVAAPSSSTAYLFFVHVGLMVVAWLVLVPVGAFFASPHIRKRLFPSDTSSNPRHIYAHQAMLFVASLLVLIAFIIGIFFIGSRTFITHLVLGIAVKALLIIQTTLGWMRTGINPTTKATTAWAKLKKKNKNLISAVHGYIGRILWVLAVANMYVGFQIRRVFGPTADLVVWGVLVGLGAMFFAAGPVYGIILQRRRSSGSSGEYTKL